MRRAFEAAIFAAMCAGVAAGGVARAQGTVYYPAQTTWGTLAFEDLFPEQGDYDFNDAVLRFNVRRHEDTLGRVTDARWGFGLWAYGAAECNGLAIRLPWTPGAYLVQRVRGTYDANGAVTWADWPVTAVTDGATGSVVEIASDLRALCGETGFINTVPGSPTITCDLVGLRVEIVTPGPTPLQFPGDVFLHDCADKSDQIHGQSHYGVPGGDYDVDESLFLTGDDASQVDPVTKEPTGTRFYTDTDGVPWRLVYSDGTYNIPPENQPVDQVLPKILDFAQGWPSGSAFWHDPAPGRAYAFATQPPPLRVPFFPSVTPTEEEYCSNDVHATGWDGSTCACLEGFAWSGTACQQVSGNASCLADGLEWVSTGTGQETCDCGPRGPDHVWNGMDCVQVADPQLVDAALACNWGTSGDHTGGGRWLGLTCDCTPVGVGYGWTGQGCHDPSQGAHAGCKASGGAWEPWNEYRLSTWQIDEHDPCDCEGLGAGWRWDPVAKACVDQGQADAARCEGSVSIGPSGHAGRWLRQPAYAAFPATGGCDCERAGRGWRWDPAERRCVAGQGEAACVAGGNTWAGTLCECKQPDARATTGKNVSPSQFTQVIAGQCRDNTATNCLATGGEWDPVGRTCNCLGSTGNPPWDTWDPQIGRCIAFASAQAGCGSSGGQWDNDLDSCTCPAGAYWQGAHCVPAAADYPQGCLLTGGKWSAVTDIESTTTFGTCECPAGLQFDDGRPQLGCLPAKELECARHGSTWSNDKCLCEAPYVSYLGLDSPMPPYATWNGQTCAYDPQREACEATEGGTWNQAAATCEWTGVLAGAAWDAVEWKAVDPPGGPGSVACRKANMSGLQGGTCDCSNWGPGVRWDPSLRQCAWSGETHGCQLDGHTWGVAANTCDCTTGWPSAVKNLDASEVEWDGPARECRDLNGHVTCETDFAGAVWSKAGTPATCQCLGWTPVAQDGRWDPIDRECVHDPMVAECVNDPYGEWDAHADTCDCSDHPDANAVLFPATWEYDPVDQQGECWSQQQAACAADPNASWQPGGCYCPHGWEYDPHTGLGNCTTLAAEQAACEADPFGEWSAAYETCYIPANPDQKWYWNGTSGAWVYCVYDLEPGPRCPSAKEVGCEAVGGTWSNYAPWDWEYCDCSTSSIPHSRWTNFGNTCEADTEVAECEASGLSWSHLYDSCDCGVSASGWDASYVGGGCVGLDACCTSAPEDACLALQDAAWDELLGCSVAGAPTCTADPDNLWYLGDLYCDVDGGFNSWMCGYDAGDCCASTNPVADCGDNCDCRDPAAP